MLFVRVHCEDEIDRDLLIPLNKIKKIRINADGSESIVTDDNEVLYPRFNNSFFESIYDTSGYREERRWL